MACIVSNEDFAVILIFVPLYSICSFPLTALKIFSSSLVFSNLIMCLGLAFFMCLLLGIDSAFCLRAYSIH